jgi:RIO kinase 1
LQPWRQRGEQTWLAAKVYRPRKFRNLKNDGLYREGRGNLDAEGREITDRHMQHAMRKRTAYGQELLHTSWLAHELTTLQILRQAGADVPQPYANTDNTILMSYIGDERAAAPALTSVHLSRRQAQSVFERVLHNLHLMLRCNRIHGDLSAYNILYWDGQITLIDFPQAITPEQNPSAYPIFERDVTRVCEYFIQHGLKLQPRQLAASLWTEYNHSLQPEVHPALLDAEDESDVAFWKNLPKPDTLLDKSHASA